jgi:hypothetical protein
MTTPTQADHDAAAPCPLCNGTGAWPDEERPPDSDDGWNASAAANYKATYGVEPPRHLYNPKTMADERSPSATDTPVHDGAGVRLPGSAQPFRPKPGERAVLESSPDGDDAGGLGHVHTIKSESASGFPSSYWHADDETSGERDVDIHRDATWRPVEAETKAEAWEPTDQELDRMVKAQYGDRGIWRDGYERGCESRDSEVALLGREKTKAELGRARAEREKYQHEVARMVEVINATKPRPVPTKAATGETIRRQIPGATWSECYRAADAVLALFSPAEPAQPATRGFVHDGGGPRAGSGPIEPTTDRAKLEAEGIRFSDFIRVHGLRVETFATHDLARGIPARGACLRLADKRCEVRVRGGLLSEFSKGATDEEAVAVLPTLYAGKALRFGASLGRYSEEDPECVKIQCPTQWLPESSIPTQPDRCPCPYPDVPSPDHGDGCPRHTDQRLDALDRRLYVLD